MTDLGVSYDIGKVIQDGGAVKQAPPRGPPAGRPRVAGHGAARV
jgi:hypothetical protein